MKQGIFQIVKNEDLGPVRRLILAGDASGFTAPGQFLDIRLPGFFLRRPISVCDWDGGAVTVLYKIMGEGTAVLSRMEPGTELDVLTGLGNGFHTAGSGDRPLLVGGGVGIAPLYRLARELTAASVRPCVVLGCRSREELFYREEFAALGAEVIVTTEDGSVGLPGFVTDGLAAAGACSFVYGCGKFSKVLYSSLCRSIWEVAYPIFYQGAALYLKKIFILSFFHVKINSRIPVFVLRHNQIIVLLHKPLFYYSVWCLRIYIYNPNRCLYCHQIKRCFSIRVTCFFQVHSPSWN